MRNASIRLMLAVTMFVATTAMAEELTVGGRVTLPGGMPLAEADVRLLPLVAGMGEVWSAVASEAPEPAARTLTDSSGRFTLVAPHAGLWTVRIDASGFVPVATDLRPFLESVELPDAELSADAGIAVKVVDQAGVPIDGARIVVRGSGWIFDWNDAIWKVPLRSAITEADGRVRLSKGEGERVSVSASAPGFALGELRGSRGTAATLRLAPVAPQPFRVESADGRPVADALVALGSRRHPVGFTSADGRIDLALEPSGETVIHLAAADGRLLETRSPGALLASGKPRVLVLADRSAVSGKLIDADSRRPIAGGVIWDAGDPTQGAVTDRAGGFALFGPTGHRMEVTGGAPGYLAASPLEHQLKDDGRLGPTLALRPAASIAGKVLDPDGNPVAGAELEVEERRTPGRLEFRFGGQTRMPLARSNEQGEYRLGPLDPDKRYTLKVRSERYAPAEQAVSGLEPYKTVSGVDVKLSTGRMARGRVTDANGRGLRDVSVTLTPARSHGSMGMIHMRDGGAAPTVYEVATDGDGAFEIAGLPAGKFDLEAIQRGFAPGKIPNVEIPTKGEPTDLGAIALAGGETVEGYVTDGDGQPLEGVEVELQTSGNPGMMMAMMPGGGGEEEPDAVTDPTGWFAIHDLSAEERYSLSFNRTGFVRTSAKAVELPRPEPLEVPMEAASDVSGTILDAAGDPIPGARVVMRRSQTVEVGGNVMQTVMMMSETADGAGRFLFEDQEPGSIALIASASGYKEATLENVDVPKGKDLEGVDIALDAGGILQGRVLAPDGRAAIGSRVRVVEEGAQQMMGMGGIETDGNGFYRLEGLEAGAASIEATHSDFPRTVRDIEVDEGINALDLEFEGGVEVSGRVIDTSGRPVPDANVRLAPVARMFGGPETRSRADGTFEMPGVQSGDYDLWVDAESYASSAGKQSVNVASNPVTGLEVQLDRGTRVSGRILGLDPGEVKRVTVRAEGEVFSGFHGQPVDHEGNYRLENLAPGTYEIVATLDDSGRRARQEARIDAGVEDLQIDLQFEPGLILSGRAHIADEPVVGATVYAEGLDIDDRGWGETSRDGAFEIKGLQAGRYEVRLRNFQTRLAYNQTVDLGTSREIELDVPTATISGRIVDSADRQPLSGVSLVLESETEIQGRLPTHTATTDVEGRFVIDNVADGDWRLAANRKGYAAIARELAVAQQRSSEALNLEMEPTEGMVLEARLPSGVVPTELRVAVLDASGEALVSGTYATGEGGRVRLSTVPRGSWRVIVSAAGSATSGFDADSPGGAIPIALEPATRLELSVTELAGTSAIASVRVTDAQGRPFYSLGWTGRPQSEWRMSGGRMEFASLPPGSWTVSVGTSDGGAWTGQATTSPGAPAELVLE